MKHNKSKKIGRRGKIVLTVLVAVMFIGIASAQLLTYYGKVETTVSVKQSVRLDNRVYSTGYGDITANDDIGDIVAGNCEWGKNHWLSLESGAQNPVYVTVDKWSNANGEFTTFIAGEVDAGPGTYVAPTSWDIEVPTDYPTITEAIASAAGGELIGVRTGTYPEIVTVDKGVTLKAINPINKPVVDAFHITADDVTVSGFKITTDIVSGEQAGVYLDPELNNIEVSYNEICDVGSGRGVLLGTYASGAAYSNVRIENNVMHNLGSGIYINSHTGIIDIFYNEFYNCEAGIGGLTDANVRRNTFHDNGEAIGADDSYQSTVIKYNNFLGDDRVKNYGNTVTVVARENWWGYDGIDVEGNVDATWFEWEDDDTITLQPGERKDFKIQYCADSMGVGDGFTASVSFK